MMSSFSLLAKVDRCSVQNTGIAVTTPKIDQDKDAGNKRHLVKGLMPNCR